MLVFDVETWQFRKGNKLPRAVAFAYQNDHAQGVLSFFYDRDEIYDIFVTAIEDGQYLVNHNIAFDMAIMANEFGHQDLATLVQQAYDNQQVRCTQVREKLRKIALGRFKFDETRGIVPRFSLAELVYEHLGENISASKKDRAAPRQNYHTVAPAGK